MDEDDDDDDSDNVSETALSFTAGTNMASATSDGMTGTASLQSTSAGAGTTTTTTPELVTGSIPSHLSSIVSNSFTGLQFHDRITASSKIMSCYYSSWRLFSCSFLKILNNIDWVDTEKFYSCTW